MQNIEIRSMNLDDDNSAGRNDDWEPEPLKNEFWEAFFNRHDKDKDGKIRIEDFIACLKSEGRNVPPSILRGLKNTFQVLDENNDQVITYAEFMNMMRSRQGSKYKKLFCSYIRYTVGPTVRYDSTDGEYEDEYSCYPPKICMAVISLLELTAFLYDWIYNGQQLSKCQFPEGSLTKIFIYDPWRRAESWRYVSYMFVHIGPQHVIVNLLIQILLGVPLEMVHGNFRVMCIYIAGVVAGSLGTSISDPTVFLAGASGGVYALMTAHIASIIMNWSEMQFAPHQMFVFVCVIVVDVGTALHFRYFGDNSSNQIGCTAHFAGAVTGLLVGINVLRNLRVKPWEKKIWWVSLVLFVVLMLSAIVINIADPSHFPRQKVPT